MEIYLGKNIKFLREKKNLGQQEFADILNVPRSTLACWENNLRTPKLEQIVKIAEYFKTNLDIIYNDYESELEKILLNKDYKSILKEKGLMDDEDNIKEEDFNKLIEIANMIHNLDKKEDHK